MTCIGINCLFYVLFSFFWEILENFLLKVFVTRLKNKTEGEKLTWFPEYVQNKLSDSQTNNSLCPKGSAFTKDI